MVATKFESLESLMNEMSLTKTKYSQKEAELKKGRQKNKLGINNLLQNLIQEKSN